MTQQFGKAIRTFNSTFLTNPRYSEPHTIECHLKIRDQLYGVIAIIFSLSQQKLDDHFEISLHEKFGDKITRIQQGFLIHIFAVFYFIKFIY